MLDTYKYHRFFKKYPHIHFRLERIWGTSTGRRYIVDLISDSRGGDRNGFPENDAKDVFHLLNDHDSAFPEFEKEVTDIVTFTSPSVRKYVHQPVQKDSNWLLKLLFVVAAVTSFYFMFHNG